MKYKLILLMVMFLFVLSFVTADRIRVGGHKIIYDEIIVGSSNFDGVNDRTSYFLEDEMVFVSYDTAGDGDADIWFIYVDGTYKETVMRDTTGDGKPDVLLNYDKEGEIISEEKRRNLPWGWIFLGAVILAIGLIYYILGKEKVHGHVQKNSAIIHKKYVKKFRKK